jgi:hypothetical protein
MGINFTADLNPSQNKMVDPAVDPSTPPYGLITLALLLPQHHLTHLRTLLMLLANTAPRSGRGPVATLFLNLTPTTTLQQPSICNPIHTGDRSGLLPGDCRAGQGNRAGDPKTHTGAERERDDDCLTTANRAIYFLDGASPQPQLPPTRRSLPRTSYRPPRVSTRSNRYV